MVVNLSAAHSLVSNWIAELRDINVQNDRMRFRRNLERIGEIAAYEISKELPATVVETKTPLGIHKSKVLAHQPVLATILRAGLPMHNGLLNYFDKADNSFISAYRKHHPDGSFEICLEYMSCPSLDNPIIKTIEHMKSEGAPAAFHVVVAIASTVGIAAIEKACGTNVKIWCGDIDDELTAKGYIVPGLGDAGDLAFGTKSQA